ncbi:hypothetical protein Q4E93_17025 [Flavitalea sp. BT771]|uniref:hypothetical protein n=1 Tax=Flavitalea sp. BT771 TaxID=3063329 RepID=UPI0026E2A08E|nr:hypothetical protein [Flavitalea sp. BT771]MDO6432308.1 hypothetical protein [Flavitalea sp. BT771]MDV6221218.1 hypothetical protein [Flavitalea sp. BT771]
MKSKKLVGLFTVVLLSGAILALAFKSGNKDASSQKYKVNFVLAKTSNELKTLRNDHKANILRTVKDFDAVVASKSTPLAKLSQAQIRDFRSSLVERAEVGIVSLKFAGIQEALSYDDFAEVMGIFGVDVKEGYWGFSHDPKIIAQLSGGAEVTKDVKLRGAKLFTDYEHYYCAALHSCLSRSDAICLTGC